MPLFHFHVRDAIGEARDEDGIECIDAEAARRTAVEGIRSILAEAVRGGELDLNGEVEIEDADRGPVARIRFAEAVRVIPPGG